jgi:hypothetical protein
MSQTINTPNYNSTNLKATTLLDKEVLVGDTALIVQNSADYTVGDTVVIGDLGSDTVEALTISAIPSPTSLTTSPATLPHGRFETVTSLLGTVVRIYRAPNVTGLQPDDTTFSLLTPVSIRYAKENTTYTDPIGSDAYWYKFTYYNPTTSEETNLADSKAVRGGGAGHYTTVDAVRHEAGFDSAPYITDAMIFAKLQAAQDEINGTLHDIYQVPFTVPINAFITDICTRLAAGLLLLEQYGQFVTQNTNNGQSKVDDARLDLDRIVIKEVVLTDAVGMSMAEAGSSGGISSWPNATTEYTDGDQGGAPRLFRMSDIQGYYGRKF